MSKHSPKAAADTDFAALQRRVLDFAEARDWLQFHSPKNLAMAIATEAGELMAHFLWCESAAAAAHAADPEHAEAIADELADVVIYCLQMANVLDLDLPAEIQRKMGRNAAKYPIEQCRGSSAKYTSYDRRADT